MTVPTLERNYLYDRQPSRQQWEDSSARNNLHVRQNFSTDRPGGYIPPHQYSSALNIRTRQSSSGDARRPVAPMPRDELLENQEIPFDLVNESHQGREPVPGRRVSMESLSSIDQHTLPLPETPFEPVWESSPERMKPEIVKTQSIAPHFSIRGPRYSDPSVMRGSRYENEDGPALNSVNSISERWNKTSSGTNLPSCSYQEIGVQPLRMAEDYTVSDHDQDDIDQVHDKRSSIDDSLEVSNEVDLQFPDTVRRPVKVTHKIRRRSPSRLRDLAEGDDDDDDDSLKEESVKPKRRSPTSLQERTQQAWKSRQKKNSSLRSKHDPEQPRAPNNVSFRGADTVQYFDPHLDEVDEVTDETGLSLDEKSLNSEYTKTLESEVEDMIKDIFFIGSGTSSQPGRRKYKYKHEVKQRLRNSDSNYKSRTEEQECSEDDLPVVPNTREARTTSDVETKTTIESPAKKVVPKKRNIGTVNCKKPTKATEISAPKKQTLNDLSETEAALWGYVDSGVAALSSALGFTSKEPTAAIKATPQSKTGETVDLCSDPDLPFETCTGRITPNEPPAKPALTEVFDYAQDMMYGQYGEVMEAHAISGSKDSSKGSHRTLPMNKDVQNDSSKESSEETHRLPFSLGHIDEDPRMTQLALYAAKSLHQTQGVEFDDSHPISMHDDLQISVVELKLPLGLIFLENDGGCFVTKVSIGGSAARSGGVEIGDQLAAINGESCSRMKVDDICDMIATAPTTKNVELVFLRYIGPYLPSRNSQVGMNGPSFDVDMSGHSPPSMKRQSSSQPNRQRSKEQDKKRGFRLFGRGKKREGSKK